MKFDPQVHAFKYRFRILYSHMERLGNTKSCDGTRLWLPIQFPKEVTVLQASSVITGQNISVIIVFCKKTTRDKSVQLYNLLFNMILNTLKMARIGFSMTNTRPWNASFTFHHGPEEQTHNWQHRVSG